MLKISVKASAVISIVFTVLFFMVLLVLAVFMPGIMDLFFGADAMGAHPVLSAVAYGLLAVAAAADILLFLLLLRVMGGRVFAGESIALIRGVSWCCILMGVLFAVIGVYYILSFVIAFAMVFLGICLRVVKNVIEEATAIKSENDLTV